MSGGTGLPFEEALARAVEGAVRNVLNSTPRLARIQALAPMAPAQQRQSRQHRPQLQGLI